MAAVGVGLNKSLGLFPESLSSCLTSSAHSLELSTCPTLHPSSREQPGTTGRALGEPGVCIWVLAGTCQWRDQGQVDRAVWPGFLYLRRDNSWPAPGITGFVPVSWNALCAHWLLPFYFFIIITIIISESQLCLSPHTAFSVLHTPNCCWKGQPC